MTPRCIFIGFALLLTCAALAPRAFAQSDAKRIVVDVLRPTGYSVARVEWLAS